jgi:hypothetical protein
LVFALCIATVTAVKLPERIALGQNGMGHFLDAKAGQYRMQINIWLSCGVIPIMSRFDFP